MKVLRHKETQLITRSSGIAVHSFIVGGGYDGKTDKLDKEVERAAIALQAEFPHIPVEIRFNSHRESGGAFLQLDIKPSFFGRTVGICVYQISPESAYHTRDGMRVGDLIRHVNVSVTELQNPALAREGNPEHKYAYVHVATVMAGSRWLRNNPKKKIERSRS